MIEVHRSIRARPVGGASAASASSAVRPGRASLLAFALALCVATGPALAADEEARRLEALAATHSMTIDRDPATAARLRAHVERFPQVGGRAGTLGPILSRRGAAGMLHVFEYTRSGISMPGPQGRLLRAAPTMLGIVMEIDGARPLPSWQQGEAQAPVPPHTEASLARLNRIEDLRMASAGAVILFASQRDVFVLKQITDQSTSKEFHPGLFNSALPIDVQRALDVVAAMDFGQRPFERFAVLPPVRTDLPATRSTGISERLQEIRREQDAKQEALRAEKQAQREAARARQQVQREAAQAQPKPRVEGKPPGGEPATPTKP
jgi:hypothetical protein